MDSSAVITHSSPSSANRFSPYTSGSPIYSEIDLSAMRVKDWYYDRVECECDCAAMASRPLTAAIGFAINLCPALYGRKSHAQSGERPWACSHSKKIILAEVQMKVLQEEFQVAKHTRRINFVRPGRNSSDHFLVAEHRQASGRRRRIEG